MSNVLFNESPLTIAPVLATKIGLNEAIVLQQVHYWLLKRTNEREGYYWVFDSIKKWQKQFPFFSEKTVQRTFAKLEKEGLLISGNFNKERYDKTKWYRINYELLEEIMKDQYFDGKSESQNDQITLGQNDQMTLGQNVLNDHDKMSQPIPKTSSKTSSKTSLKDNMSSKLDDAIPFELIIDYLNEKTESRYDHETGKTRSLIKARFAEGRTVEDFKTVIDKKTDHWLKNPEMCKYLRPSTLFGNKFVEYLNEKVLPKQQYQQPKTHTNEQYMYSNDMKDDGLPF